MISSSSERDRRRQRMYLPLGDHQVPGKVLGCTQRLENQIHSWTSEGIVPKLKTLLQAAQAVLQRNNVSVIRWMCDVYVTL